MSLTLVTGRYRRRLQRGGWSGRSAAGLACLGCRRECETCRGLGSEQHQRMKNGPRDGKRSGDATTTVSRASDEGRLQILFRKAHRRLRDSITAAFHPVGKHNAVVSLADSTLSRREKAISSSGTTRKLGSTLGLKYAICEAVIGFG